MQLTYRSKIILKNINIKNCLSMQDLGLVVLHKDQLIINRESRFDVFH